MGNCINSTLFPPRHRLKDLAFHGGNQDFRMPAPEENIGYDPFPDENTPPSVFTNSAFQPDAVVEAGETENLASEMVALQTHRVDVAEITSKRMKIVEGRKVKIVVTKDQLHLLLKKSKKLSSRGLAVRFSDGFMFGSLRFSHGLRFGQQTEKWRPNLPTIPEVQE